MVTPSSDSSRVPKLPFEDFCEKGHSWARPLGSLLLGRFLFCLAFALPSSHAAQFLMGGGVLGFVVTVIGSFIPMYFGARFILRARCYCATSAEKLLARDPRPPVLYFRPFAADRTAGKGVVFSSWLTEEEQLAKLMYENGPFVAIGVPGEALPELGASRFYIPDAVWHEAVQYLLACSRLVVLRVGRSPSFWWELENALHDRKPEELSESQVS